MSTSWTSIRTPYCPTSCYPRRRKRFQIRGPWFDTDSASTILFHSRCEKSNVTSTRSRFTTFLAILVHIWVIQGKYNSQKVQNLIFYQPTSCQWSKKSTILSFDRSLPTMTIASLWSTMAAARDSRRQSTSHLHSKLYLYISNLIKTNTIDIIYWQYITWKSFTSIEILCYSNLYLNNLNI